MAYYLKGYSEHTIKNTPRNEKIKELVERWDSGYRKNIEKGIEIYNKLSDEEIDLLTLLTIESSLEGSFEARG